MSLTALSPLDNRYAEQLADLAPCFSQYALIAHRVRVEIEWLLFQSECPELAHVRPFTAAERALLQSWITTFDESQAERVSEIERTTDHDVKAVEYYLKERLLDTTLADVREARLDNPYERLKALTRGTAITREDLRSFIHALDIPEADKQRLLALTPATYIGLAPDLVDHIAPR